MEINGKNLGRILNADLKGYKELYPNRKEKGYCACMDLVPHAQKCKGMLTVMDVLKKKRKYELPDSIRTIRGTRKYGSGEIWLDEISRIAYLYIGKDNCGRDVVLNLGGETANKGDIMIGEINKMGYPHVFFDKRVFPKG
ncbi:MAG TPA: hypothetical protein PK255_03835 [Candidatus Pacearchaeota archaeon]|nr:hypothetical protein [Candidatus Pacearchaeota archaeon]HQF83247.1 hypothetical protein [Candidatus Pacearchaeota archaeon]HQJ58189.1 hypothetical protein [Candidatus Pacearchaeota archaeon]